MEWTLIQQIMFIKLIRNSKIDIKDFSIIADIELEKLKKMDDDELNKIYANEVLMYSEGKKHIY